MTKNLKTIVIVLGSSIIGTIFLSSLINADSYDVASSCLNVLDPFVRLYMISAVVLGFKMLIDDHAKMSHKRKKQIHKNSGR